MYWITYVLVPVVAGIVAVSGPVGAKRPEPSARRVVRHNGWIALAMLVCAVLNLLDFVDIMGELNGLGKVLFVTILGAQLGVGIVAGVEWLVRRVPRATGSTALLQRRLIEVEACFGVPSLATGVIMMLLRIGFFPPIF